MKLNIYKNQKEIEKTFEVNEYDIMYGTVEDIFDILEGVEDTNDLDEMLKIITKSRSKLNELLLEIFGDEGLTQEDLRKVKVKELVPMFIDLFTYVAKSFKSKN